jgi:hypothetical protein
MFYGDTKKGDDVFVICSTSIAWGLNPRLLINTLDIDFQ